jgi:hypothetical protein
VATRAGACPAAPRAAAPNPAFAEFGESALERGTGSVALGAWSQRLVSAQAIPSVFGGAGSAAKTWGEDVGDDVGSVWPAAPTRPTVVA